MLRKSLFPLYAGTSQLLRRLLVPASQPRSRIVETRINHRFISFLLALSASRRKNRRLEDFYLLTQQESKKSKPIDLDFFICAVRHNIMCVAHATSFDRRSTSLPLAAQMNEVVLRANEVAASRKRCDASHQ